MTAMRIYNGIIADTIGGLVSGRKTRPATIAAQRVQSPRSDLRWIIITMTLAMGEPGLSAAMITISMNTYTPHRRLRTSKMR
jgi:hypothetical protein